jgi:hypothetical protein
MAGLPTLYYVQTSRTDSFFGLDRRWETVTATFDRATAEQYAESLERAVVFDQSEDISKLVSTVARVVTAESLRAESEDARALAEARTRTRT